MHPEGRGVLDRGDGLRIDPAVVVRVVALDELEGHDLDRRRDADDPGAVQGRGDRAGDMGPVEVVAEVVDRVVLVAEVPAVDVVDLPVRVVVEAVGLLAQAGFARVDPGPAGEVRVAEVDAVVDDRDDKARSPGRDPVRLERVDVGIGLAFGAREALEQALAGVMEPPQLLPVGLAASDRHRGRCGRRR